MTTPHVLSSPAADRRSTFTDLRAEWPLYVEWMTLEREALMRDCDADRLTRSLEYALCAQDPIHWLRHWVWTEDPRELGGGIGRRLPFIPWPRQVECFEFLLGAIARREERIVAKSRDQGYSWLTVAVAVYGWLFRPGFIATFGSRVEDLVDKKGDPDSLFEKVRFLVSMLPWWMLPVGFNARDHSLYMQLVNPANGAVIKGAVGENMGRGGRATVVFIDEGAFLAHDAMVDRAVSANSDARIWGSTANGRGNVFAEKWFSERYPTFQLHYRDDPRKGPEWEAKERAGSLPFVFASEHEIDFSASVEGLLIEMPWIRAAVQLWHELNQLPDSARRGWTRRAGLDIGAGKAESVLMLRAGPLVERFDAWTDPDSIDTAHKALDGARSFDAATLCYDAPGVGQGVAAVLNRAAKPPEVYGVNTGEAASENVTLEDERTGKQAFANLKAQLWWSTRERFRRTHEFVVEGREHPLEELIAIPPDGKLETQLNTPQWNRTLAGKIAIVSKKNMAGPSPDRADALVLTEHQPDPVDEFRFMGIRVGA